MNDPRTIDDWINSLPEDERETMCVADAWKAGARAMLNAIDQWKAEDGNLHDYVKDILMEKAK